MCQRYFFDVYVSRWSNRVTWPCITASSVETCEPEDVWTSMVCPVKHCRLRPPSLVQFSPFLLSRLPCCCFSLCCCCCARSWVLHVFCPCFRSFALAFVPSGLKPSLLADPRRGFYSFIPSCPCLSLSCPWSCCCPIKSGSCIPLPCFLCFCLSMPGAFSSCCASSPQ